MVEGANSKRGLANRTSSRGCCGRDYRIQARHRSLRGCPSANTYDNLCSLSDSQPYSHRHAHAYAYTDTTPDTHSCPARTHGHLYAHADADPDPHAHPYARLQRTIPKLGVAILR